MTDTVRYMAKAIIAAIVAGLGTAATAVVSDGVVAGEWIAIAITTLVALGAVFEFPNAPKPRPAEGPTTPPEGI